MSSLTAVTTDSFNSEVLESTQLVVVDFWAVWCAPCKMITPSLEALATQYEDQVSIVKVDIDQERDVAENYSVQSIPTLLFFRNGRPVDQIVGAVPKKLIEEKILHHLY